MSAPAAIAEPGRNCWRVDRADRFFCVQDAADYFRLVRQALLSARHTVFSLGWDITAQIDMLPGAPATDAPTRLDKLLVHIARRRPQLRCYILTWDYGALYTLERDPFSRWRLGWRTPRNVRFGFDDRHPVGASHHQKVIVVDDQLAFCGGIDLTSHRWDTSAHQVDEPLRKTPLGVKYGPYHEVQAMVSGPPAAALGVLARERWRALDVRRIPTVGGPEGPPYVRRPGLQARQDLWPSEVTPDLTSVNVAIARTMPATETAPEIRECEALFDDSIARATRTIYIESQYFTSDALAGKLAERLKEPAGPEIIVVTPRDCHGWLEQNTMGAFRDEAFRRMIAADAHNRLRIVCPLASQAEDVPTFVHSKVMVVDDHFVRIGSANFSQRSMGMDTECDVAAETGDDPKGAAGVRLIRHRLLGEHLDLPVEEVERGIETAGSVRAFIDTREHADHTLTRLCLPDEPTPPSEVLRDVADPAEPIAFAPSIQQLIPAADARGARSPLLVWILPGVAVAAATAVAWARWASFLPPTPPSFWVAATAFVIAGLVLIPLELLAIVAGLVVGWPGGLFVSTAGSLVAAIIGYAAGRWMGPSRLSGWMSRRSYRAGQQLGARGVIGVLVLRFTSVASAGAINLLCGAGGVPFTTYIAGTAIGLTVAMAALSGLGALLRDAFLHPSPVHAFLALGAAVLLFVLAAGLRTLLVIRQFASSVSGHRGRAEFG